MEILRYVGDGRVDVRLTAVEYAYLQAWDEQEKLFAQEEADAQEAARESRIEAEGESPTYEDEWWSEKEAQRQAYVNELMFGAGFAQEDEDE